MHARAPQLCIASLGLLSAVGCLGREAPRFAVHESFGAMTEVIQTVVPLRASRPSIPLLSHRYERVGPDTAVSRRCRELLLRNEAVLTLAAPSGAACERRAQEAVRAVYSQCTVAPGGGWATQVRSVRYSRRPGGCAAEGEWRLIGIDRDGAPAEEHERLGAPPTNVPAHRWFSFAFEGEAMVESTDVALIASDLDGDQRPEVVLVGEAHRVVDDVVHSDREIEVRTAFEEEVQRYAPTAAVPMVDAVDEDQDGRVDFIIDGPYGWTAPGDRCDQATERSPLRLLLHALPDGSLSGDDAVARAYLARQCPDPGESALPSPMPLTSSAEAERAGLALVCALAWGARPREALEAMRCHHARAVTLWSCESREPSPFPMGPRECPSHFRRWARMEPPLRLRALTRRR